MNYTRRVLFTLIVPLLAATQAVAAISGTFIQPWLTANWDDARWQQEYAMLSEAGMDKLIFMHTVNTSKDGCRAVYPTKINDITPSSTDNLDLCLRNARKAGFKVIVGLNFDEQWWNTGKWTPEWIMAQMNIGNLVAKELVENYQTRYPDTFAGWYWTWEIEDSFLGAMPQLIEYLVAAMNVNLDCLHTLTPDLPVMVSPFMNSQRSNPENCANVWRQILSKAHFKDGDILAPQDCVGSGFLKIDESARWFEALGKVVPTSPEIRFWANIESFDQRFWTAAPLSRIKKQIDNVAPYVSDMITFAYSHYYSPAQKTPELHKAYCVYATTGELPDYPTPKAVKGLKLAKDNNGRSLLWNKATCECCVLGYHVYSNGSLIADVQPKVQDNKEKTCHWQVPADITGEITVKAYNVIGTESPSAKINL